MRLTKQRGAGRARSSALALLAVLALVHCSSSEPEVARGSAVEHGRVLFEQPGASTSASNPFACATCHRAEKAVTRVDPGAPLGGATVRRSFWGGTRVDLLEAINDCRSFFMDAPRPWTATDEDARALYAFLAQVPAGQPAADHLPFTIVTPIDLPAGDPKRGAAAYALACQTCHGRVHDGDGRLAPFIPTLPDDVLRSHAPLGLTADNLRLVFVDKVRGGAFRGGGSMPPFSREALGDEDLAGIIASFALY